MKLGATIAMISLIGGIGVASMPVELSTTLDNNKTITSKYKEEDSTTVSSTIITANIGTSSSGLKTEIHTTLNGSNNTTANIHLDTIKKGSSKDQILLKNIKSGIGKQQHIFA